MVTDLPEKGNGAYTESSLKQVLQKFGSMKFNKCYILPDNCTVKLKRIHTLYFKPATTYLRLEHPCH